MTNRCNWNKVKPLAPSWKAAYFIFDVNVKGVEEGSVLIRNQEQNVSEMSRRHRDESRWWGGGVKGTRKTGVRGGKKLERSRSGDERVH